VLCFSSILWCCVLGYVKGIWHVDTLLQFPAVHFCSPAITQINSEIVMPLPSNGCISSIMFLSFPSVRECVLPCACASIWVCSLLAQYLTNQLTEFFTELWLMCRGHYVFGLSVGPWVHASVCLCMHSVSTMSYKLVNRISLSFGWWHSWGYRWTG